MNDFCFYWIREFRVFVVFFLLLEMQKLADFYKARFYKRLDKGMICIDVYLCCQKLMNRSKCFSYQPEILYR